VKSCLLGVNYLHLFAVTVMGHVLDQLFQTAAVVSSGLPELSYGPNGPPVLYARDKCSA